MTTARHRFTYVLSRCLRQCRKPHVTVFQMGGYRYADFLRVGVPLNLLTWFAAESPFERFPILNEPAELMVVFERSGSVQCSIRNPNPNSAAIESQFDHPTHSILAMAECGTSSHSLTSSVRRSCCCAQAERKFAYRPRGSKADRRLSTKLGHCENRMGMEPTLAVAGHASTSVVATAADG